MIFSCTLSQMQEKYVLTLLLLTRLLTGIFHLGWVKQGSGGTVRSMPDDSRAPQDPSNF